MRIKCASVDCKYSSPTNYCKYPGVLKISDCYINTVNEGYQHFHRCKMYEQDESIEEMQKDIIEFFKGKC